MAKQVNVQWIEGHVWEAESGGHTVRTEVVATPGAASTAMSPGELLVAAAATCMCTDLSFYARRHPEIDLSRVRIAFTWEDAPDGPSRIARITGTITFPPDLPEDVQASLRRVLASCKVSRTVRQGAEVDVGVRFGDRV
jgi:uncharacterized OsmC-like protein